MPRHSAAEAMPSSEPQKDQEIEELPSDLLKEEPPPVPETEDTKEALQTLKELAETRDAHLAAEERKKILETRDKAATERMRRNMGASVLHELPPEDVKLDDESSTWVNQAERTIGPRKRQEPPPIPAAAKKPEAKKPWYKRLFGSKE